MSAKILPSVYNAKAMAQTHQHNSERYGGKIKL